MQILRKLTNSMLALLALVTLASAALAAEPGIPYPVSEISDQKAGSVLIYNAYTSAALPDPSHDTHISITNTSAFLPSFVHLFFVDGETCSVADAFVCLTPCQIACFLASDLDPGVNGYIVAVATDALGCPVSHNFLLGSARVRYSSAVGHEADLGAEAIAALYTGSLPTCTPASETATLPLDGVLYNLAPRVLLAEPLFNPAAASQLVVVNRIGGSLLTTAAPVGALFGILTDDAENKFSFTVRSARCQFLFRPPSIRTAPPFTSVIPPGRCGFMSFWGADDTFAYTGAIFTTSSAVHPTPFSSGKNLHKKTLTRFASYTIPVFAPPC